MKLIHIILLLLLALLYCFDEVDKGGDVIYVRLTSNSLLIITSPYCYSYTSSNGFNFNNRSMPPVSKGAVLLKASPNDVILVSSTPFFLLHLDINCSIIQRHNTLHQTKADHPFKLSLLSTGDVITAWAYQSNLYLMKYSFNTKNFSVQTYPFPNNNSNNLLCEEITLNKLLCIYYANNSIMFGLYNLLTFSLLNELSSNIIDINQIDTNGYLFKTSTSNEILYCIKGLGSQVLCFNIKESNDLIKIQNSVFIQDWFSWTNSHQLFIWELPNKELLILSREDTLIKTQKGFTDLTMKGTVYSYDFSNLIDGDIDFNNNILFEARSSDNMLLVLYKTRNFDMLKMALLSMGSLNDKLFIGLRPIGGQVNIGYYINHSFIIFYSLPSRGRFTELDYSDILLSKLYDVNDVLFLYDPIVNPDNTFNEWMGIEGTVSSQGDSFDLAIFSHQKPIIFGYCYKTCDTCLDLGKEDSHNCIECASGLYHLATDMKKCFNEETRPINSFWDVNLNYYNLCFGNCETCHQRGDKDNHLCDSCKLPQHLQPKGDLNCVLLCEKPLRWYVDLDGNYNCTKAIECPIDYSYYNPTTNECLRKCIDNNEVYYQFECHSDCPFHAYIDEQKGECHDYCPDQYAIDDLNRKCVNCALNGTLNYNKTCIEIASKPDNSYISNKEYNVVKDCFEIDIETGVIKTNYGIIPECAIQCPLYHYYLPNKSTCHQCYATCETCFQNGSDHKHNCIKCKDNYISHPIKKGMCMSKCPLYWFINSTDSQLECTDNCAIYKLILNTETSECINDCDQSQVIYDNKCLSECPDSNMIIHNYKCYPENASQIEMENDWRDLINNKNDSLNDYYNNLSDISPSIIENDNFTIQVFDPKNESAIKDAIDNNLSLIDLGPCEDILREHYRIPDNKSLLILKIDIKENNTGLTPVVKYKVFDHEGNRLDLSLCDDIQIEIDYPIINEDNIDLNKGKEYNDKGIDVFAPKDPFFNDICYPYSTSDDKDIPIEDRRNDIYQNASFCQTGCSYQGIDYETKRVLCQCNATINDIEDEIKNELFGEVFDLFDSSTIMVVTCYKLLFQLNNIIFNIGFWFFGVLTLMIIVTSSFFSCCGTIKLYAYLNQFPKQKQDDGKSNKNKEKTSMPVPLSNPSSPPIKQKGSTAPQNNRLVVVTPSYEHGEDYFISKDTNNPKKGYRFRRCQLESNDELLCTPKKKESDIIDVRMNSKLMAMTMIPTAYNTPIGLNKNGTSKSPISKAPTGIIIESPFSTEKIGNETKTHIKSLTVTPLKLEDDKSLNKQGTFSNSDTPHEKAKAEVDIDYDSLEIEEAMIKDQRNLCLIFWANIKSNQMIISLFTNKSPFAPFLIRLILFIFTMSLFFSMNALLFTDKQISTRYHSNDDLNMLYIIKNEFTKCLYATLITSLVTSAFMFLVSNYNIRKIIKEAKDPDEYILGIKKNLATFKTKIYCFFGFTLLVVMFCWYFVTLFCIVYVNNRISWIEGSSITFAFSNLLGFVMLFISGILRFIANKMKSWCLFKLSLFVKDFAT